MRHFWDRDAGVSHLSSRGLTHDGESWPSPWEPMHAVDYAMLGFTAMHQLITLGVVVHLVWRRDWPPYVTKNVTLVAATGVGSTMSLLGGLIANGAIGRHPGDVLAMCGVEASLEYLGTALHLFPAFVRVYRNYTLLILHSAGMWSGMVQLLAVSLPYLIPPLVYMAKPGLAEFEPFRNRCFDRIWLAEPAFLYVATGISGAIVMVIRMRRVRKQLNEFRVMTTSLAFLLLWALYLLPACEWVWRDSPCIPRRLVMIDNFVSTVVLFWCPIAVPFVRYLQKDDEYVSQFTFGFSRLPTPAQMRASLADQLEVEGLRRKFRKYAAGRVAPELPDFYKACMDREQVEGYFERQAVTMAIIDRFVMEGAPQQVNISDQCRQTILDSDITRYNIFDDAIAEVLNVMEVNFKADFERTMEYRKLNRAVEREARELAILRQAKLMVEPKCQSEDWPRPYGGRSTLREARDIQPSGATRPATPRTVLDLSGNRGVGSAVRLMADGRNPASASTSSRKASGSLMSAAMSPLVHLATPMFLSSRNRRNHNGENSSGNNNNKSNNEPQPQHARLKEAAPTAGSRETPSSSRWPRSSRSNNQQTSKASSREDETGDGGERGGGGRREGVKSRGVQTGQKGGKADIRPRVWTVSTSRSSSGGDEGDGESDLAGETLIRPESPAPSSSVEGNRPLHEDPAIDHQRRWWWNLSIPVRGPSQHVPVAAAVAAVVDGSAPAEEGGGSCRKISGNNQAPENNELASGSLPDANDTRTPLHLGRPSSPGSPPDSGGMLDKAVGRKGAEVSEGSTIVSDSGTAASLLTLFACTRTKSSSRTTTAAGVVPEPPTTPDAVMEPRATPATSPLWQQRAAHTASRGRYLNPASQRHRNGRKQRVAYFGGQIITTDVCSCVDEAAGEGEGLRHASVAEPSGRGHWFCGRSDRDSDRRCGVAVETEHLHAVLSSPGTVRTPSSSSTRTADGHQRTSDATFFEAFDAKERDKRLWGYPTEASGCRGTGVGYIAAVDQDHGILWHADSRRRTLRHQQGERETTFGGAEGESIGRRGEDHADSGDEVAIEGCGHCASPDSFGAACASSGISRESSLTAISAIDSPAHRVDCACRRERARLDAAAATAVAMAAAIVSLGGGAVEQSLVRRTSNSVSPGCIDGNGCVAEKHRRSLSNPDSFAAAVAAVASFGPPTPSTVGLRTSAASEEQLSPDGRGGVCVTSSGPWPSGGGHRRGRSSTGYVGSRSNESSPASVADDDQSSTRASSGDGDGETQSAAITVGRQSCGQSYARNNAAHRGGIVKIGAGVVPPPSPRARSRRRSSGLGPARDGGRRSSSMGSLARRSGSTSPSPGSAKGVPGRGGGGGGNSSSSSSAASGSRRCTRRRGRSHEGPRASGGGGQSHDGSMPLPEAPGSSGVLLGQGRSYGSQTTGNTGMSAVSTSLTDDGELGDRSNSFPKSAAASTTATRRSNSSASRRARDSPSRTRGVRTGSVVPRSPATLRGRAGGMLMSAYHHPQSGIASGSNSSGQSSPGVCSPNGTSLTTGSFESVRDRGVGEENREGGDELVLRAPYRGETQRGAENSTDDSFLSSTSSNASDRSTSTDAVGTTSSTHDSALTSTSSGTLSVGSDASAGRSAYENFVRGSAGERGVKTAFAVVAGSSPRHASVRSRASAGGGFNAAAAGAVESSTYYFYDEMS